MVGIKIWELNNYKERHGIQNKCVEHAKMAVGTVFTFLRVAYVGSSQVHIIKNIVLAKAIARTSNQKETAV